VGALRRAAVVAAAALALAPAAAAKPLVVHARLDDTTVLFGEPIQARVSVVADRSVRRSSIRVDEDLAPLTVTASAHTARAGSVVEVTRVAVCMTAPCVARTFPRLRSVVVTATLRDGRSVRATASWPQLSVRGRVVAADLARARPPFRASVAVPPATYRIDPATLAWLLVALAIVTGLGALALGAGELRRRRARAPRASRDPLERALRLVREAESRPAPDRRRAAGLLARLLRDRDAPLARTASDLAWAKPQPEPDDLEVLASDTERTAR